MMLEKSRQSLTNHIRALNRILFCIILLLLQFVAKKLDKRLVDLGGRPIIEKGLGDDQHPSGYDVDEML